ncbi:MAG: hypothetical protein JSW18_01560 [Candidatus Omnitrophota bacterium]|nr:MAG: hypothetical protein JSW18_01560 [Candidatus Omnitrophota bacterium]
MGIEKGHLKICDDLAKEVNKRIRGFSLKAYRINPNKYEKLLDRKDLTIETKKGRLLKALHETILCTLSVDPHRISHTDILDDFKLNVRLVRAIIFKLRDMNYYQEDVLLHELGLKAKPRNWGEIIKEGIKELKEKSRLGKEDLDKLEHTISRMIGKVITLDEKLLRTYKKKEAKIVKDERLGIKDLEDVLGKESELLMHLEAKFPPPNKVKADLLGLERFNHWMVVVLTALSALEHMHKKEASIFQKLKQSGRLKKKIESRIDYVVKEKFELMQIKEQRALSWEHIGKIDEALHEAAHKYLAASQL